MSDRAQKPDPAIIFVAVMASLLEIIDTSIVNVSIPTMMGNLGATLEDISMVITGYAIANAVVLPLSGWLSERIGRRKYYLGCIFAFTAVSVACGLAPNLTTLIVFRILQGLFGGALLPTSQALIYEQFPKEKAGIAGAVFGMSVMIGPTLGPVLGGYLTDNFGWRSIFNINLPLGLLTLFIGWTVIKDRAGAVKPSKDSFDTVGLMLLCLGVGCLQYVLERGEADDWFSSHMIILNSIIAVICIPTFIWWELKTEHPVIDVRLFIHPLVRNGVTLMAIVGFFLYGVVFLLPVFVGRTFHYTATQTGALFIPGSILTALMMPFIGKRLQAGTNPKVLIFIGFLTIEFFLILLTQISPLTSRSDIFLYLYARGAAMAFLFIPINSSILSQFSGAALGQVSGLLNLFRQIGGSMGIALVGTMLTKYQKQNVVDLGNHVTLLDADVFQQFSGTVQSLGSKMSNAVGNGVPYEAAMRLFQYRVEMQAFMLSFNQVIWIMITIVALSLIPLWRLKLTMKVIKPIDAH